MKNLLILLALFIVGCAGGPQGQDGKSGMVRVERFDGGTAIFAGIDHNNNGVLDDNEINSVSQVLDGVDGQDAQAFVTEVIDPCGPSGGVDEILLVTHFGVMAWYKNTGLVLLKDGTYQTTDKQKCVFTVAGGLVL